MDLTVNFENLGVLGTTIVLTVGLLATVFYIHFIKRK